MEKMFPLLPVITLKSGLSYSHSPYLPEVIHFNDPALHAMFDFKYANVISVYPDAMISEVAMSMRISHTHLLLVIDKENNVIGFISLEDILGEKPLQVTQERKIKRSEILVRMVMTRLENIIAFDYADLIYAKVGNVAQTLNHRKQHYALAVEIDPKTDEQIVRGFFSLSSMSKQLGVDVISGLSEAHSLAELQHTFKK